MNRRQLLMLLAGAITAARALRAEQKTVSVIGWLGLGTPQAGGTRYVLAAFRQGLGEADFVEGQNVAVEYRWGGNMTACRRWPRSSSGGRST